MGLVPTRLPPLLDRTVLFARRGGRADSQDQARETFLGALRDGATGWHADAWLTGDGDVVIDPTGLVRRVPRRRIRERPRADLAAWLSLDDLLALPSSVPVRLGLAEPEAARAVIDVARRHDATDRLWLGHPDLEVLADWRDLAADVHLVNATTISALPLGAERRAAELAAARIEAVALPENDWSGGQVTLFHRFEVLAFADGAHYERQLVRLVDMGIDGVSGDHVDRMVAVAATFD